MGNVIGVGIDLASVSELRELDARTGGVFVHRTFSAREQAEADAQPDRYAYLTGRFAVKEAVFKAVAHLLPEKTYDLRIVETLRQPDGSPQVQPCPVFAAAGVAEVLVSISTQGDFAIAIAEAVGIC